MMTDYQYFSDEWFDYDTGTLYRNELAVTQEFEPPDILAEQLRRDERINEHHGKDY